ncbi:MAG: GntR family transcriptional regulator [Acidocella sp.]|nr:GntR family transcriptional regulator [Acidocella sp.]
MSQTVSALLSLRALILAGELAPGARLTEIAVAARLGVSRTPLRAALAQLAAEGLLDALASGGYAVRDFTGADIDDAIELRGVLEGVAARFAAERGVAADALAPLRGVLAQIDALLANRGQDGAFQSYVALNEAFHARLTALAGSGIVARELARVAALPFASPSAFVLAQSRADDGWDILVVAQAQHHAMLEAIAAREGARAEALMREHARLARRNLRRAQNAAQHGAHDHAPLLARRGVAYAV